MKQIHFKKSPRLLISRALIAFLLISVLAACGANSAATGSTPTQTHSGSTANKPTNASTPLNLNPTNISAKIGDLLMQSSDGFQCPYTSSQPSNDLELGHLVLASERTTYSQAEIAQMSAYLAYYVRNGGVLNGKVLRGGTQPPPTLRWALGGEPGGLHSTTGTPIGIPGAPPPLFVCGAELTLTNTGNTPIQITKVGVQLKARPQQNTYQYRLIDACSLDISSCVILGSGGGGDCSVYSASIQLGPGKQNDVFSAVPTASPGCSALTIPPNTQISLNLSFYPAAAIPQNLMYSIVPVLMVDTTQGEQTLAFSQLGSTLAFASANQFSCYALQGTTFVLERSPVFSLSGNPTPIPGGQHWCL